MENSVTIEVQGGATVTGKKSATFEQAFLGEPFSDIKGKGRARRKKRKLTKISDKDEVKRARQGSKVGRRGARKAQRQDVRAEQQEARMSRRGRRISMKEEREEGRQGRKDLRSTRGAERENYEAEQDVYRNGLYPEETEETPSTSQDLGYDDEGAGYESDSETPQAYEPEESISEGYQDDNLPMYETETGTTEDEMDEEESGFISEATGKTISSKPKPTQTRKDSSAGIVQEICMKIEWNNEFVDRLKQKRDAAVSKGGSPEKYNAEMIKRMDRAKELEGQLDTFSSVDGVVQPERISIINKAKRNARMMRMKLHQPKSNDNVKSYIVGDPDFSDWQNTGSENGITVENLDNPPVEDVYYNSDSRDINVDLAVGEPTMNFSGVDGSKSDNSNMIKSIIIGGLVAFGTIWLIRKYKLLK